MAPNELGVLEFLLNSTVGKLSDTYGRRRFLLLSPIVNCALKFAVFVNQSPLMLIIERVTNGAAPEGFDNRRRAAA